ncbi:MAG: transposase [Anaerolineae bacterium]|nr:transposase [Anaerolineae bacterium]
MTYDPDKHHRRSIRLQGYDYQKAGAYFVTICLHHGGIEYPFLFGTITNGQVELNEYGLEVQKNWLFLPTYYQELELDEYIIMPNHFHGILVLGDKSPAGLSKIIQGFKTFSAKRINQIRKLRGIPVWQRNFYEHVIRNEQDLSRIREYIINNPAKWTEDEYHVA